MDITQGVSAGPESPLPAGGGSGGGATGGPAPGRRAAKSLLRTLHRRPRLRLALLLAAPLAWLIVAYLGALAALFLSAFWTTDPFTSDVVRTWTLANFREVLTTSVYWHVALRTLGTALAVTAVDIVVAFPIAFWTARVAAPRHRNLLVVAVLTPLWASYLVKAYAWRTLLSTGGPLDWALKPLGLSGPGYGLPAVIIVLAYLWLPYMILPIHAGLANLPDDVLDAAADLGARTWRTFRTVVLPLVLPSVAAGSVFTFSLSLGDYIAVQIVGGKTQLIGNAIYSDVTLDLPLAAALGTIPVAVVVLYLLAIRRSGALDSL